MMQTTASRALHRSAGAFRAGLTRPTLQASYLCSPVRTLASTQGLLDSKSEDPMSLDRPPFDKYRPVQIQNYCGFQVPNTATETSSPIIRNSALNDALYATPFANEPNIDTCWRVVERAFSKFADNDMLGQRPNNQGGFAFQSYGDVGQDVARLGTWLTTVFGLKSQDRVAIFGINSDKWLKTAMAAWRQGMAGVPLYDTLGPSSTSYILKDCGARIVFADKKAIKILLDSIEGTSVEEIVQFQPDLEPEHQELASAKGITLSLFDQVLSSVTSTVDAQPGTPDSLAYVMYTSGTSGTPKGVMLSHENVLASVAGVVRGGIYVNQPKYFSFLPLAHCYETLNVLGVTCNGGAVGFFGGDRDKFMEDLVVLSPTVFSAVPRIYARFQGAIKAGLDAAPGWRQWVFNFAYEQQRKAVQQGKRSKFWDKLVFDKIAKKFGGNFQLMSTGAAPMTADMMEFIRVVFGVQLHQGYGATETAAAALVTPSTYLGAGNVGEPIACCEIKLIDCPELNFTTQGDVCEGEILIRGPSVFKGYLNQPKMTAEALDEDGWFHTGDIGRINPDGAIQIIDRKSSMFKLSQGEFVAPEPLEDLYKTSKFIEQIYVHGERTRSSLVAIVVPSAEAAMVYMKKNGITAPLPDVLVCDWMKDTIRSELDRLAKKGGLPGFQQIKGFHLENRIDSVGQAFTVENDLATPTTKLKRKQLREAYASEISALYAQFDQP
eukprot:m.90870 g.90870  ORF g.90870 m.90870 type:complete len:719 (-) comp12931_c0_seq1:218-2374(-)